MAALSEDLDKGIDKEMGEVWGAMHGNKLGHAVGASFKIGIENTMAIATFNLQQ